MFVSIVCFFYEFLVIKVKGFISSSVLRIRVLHICQIQIYSNCMFMNSKGWILDIFNNSICCEIRYMCEFDAFWVPDNSQVLGMTFILSALVRPVTYLRSTYHSNCEHSNSPVQMVLLIFRLLSSSNIQIWYSFSISFPPWTANRAIRKHILFYSASIPYKISELISLIKPRVIPNPNT